MGLDNVYRFTQLPENMVAVKGYWESDNVFINHYHYVGHTAKGKTRIVFGKNRLNYQEDSDVYPESIDLTARHEK